MNKYVVAGGVIVVGAGLFAYSFLKKAETEPEDTVVPIEQPVENGSTQENGSTTMAAAYRDGTYSVVGPYKYHTGDEHIFMEITLTDGVITESVVTSDTENPVSIRMIERFNGGYKPLVIGKHIDEVKLGVVSGSSLTPIGFMAGLEAVKAEARPEAPTS